MSKLSNKGRELGCLLKKYITNKNAFTSLMLLLTVNQEDPDLNYQKLIDFINECVEVNYEKIMQEVERILEIDK